MELGGSSRAPAHCMSLLHRGDSCCLEDPPDLLYLGHIRELRLVPGPQAASRLAFPALPQSPSPLSRGLWRRCRRHEQLDVVPGPPALERRRLFATDMEAPEEVLRKGTMGAEEGVPVPQGPHKLLSSNLVRLAFLHQEEQGDTRLGALLLRELKKRQVGESELATALATEDKVVPCEDVEPGPEALEEKGEPVSAWKGRGLPGFSDPEEAGSASS